MTLDGTYTATIDRIVDGQAVLLIEDDEETVAERHLPSSELPDGAGEGAVCEVTLADDEVVDVSYRPVATDERRERAREKFDRLSRRLGDASGDPADDDEEQGVDDTEAHGDDGVDHDDNDAVDHDDDANDHGDDGGDHDNDAGDHDDDAEVDD